MKFCTKAFLLTNLQSVSKIVLLTNFNKVDNLSRHCFIYWGCLIHRISSMTVYCIITSFMKIHLRQHQTSFSSCILFQFINIIYNLIWGFYVLYFILVCWRNLVYVDGIFCRWLTVRILKKIVNLIKVFQLFQRSKIIFISLKHQRWSRYC